MTVTPHLSKEFSDGNGGVRYLISDFCTELESYLEEDEIKEVYRAYLFSAEAHEGQTRISGEPYIYHPLAVARILSEMRMDYQCLMAAILHDVIEDTPTAKEQLNELFGSNVAELVDGVSKLTHLAFESREEAQAANFRKMLLAMNKDIRVILIKLADRLHNMRTLGVMRPEKRRRIAHETLDIYAPIASRLGINNIRQELEELGFASYWPLRYRVFEASVLASKGNRSELVQNTLDLLSNRLKQDGIDADVLGREKHLYGIYRKMQEKHLSFHDVMDFFGFRIIVDTVDTCYRVLGSMHNVCLPVPGKFKDYIAIPKTNGYQSLHTILKGPNGLPIEVQIRTKAMHQVAEAGVAAHWKYKEGGTEAAHANNNISSWLKDLMDLQEGAGNSIEFMEHVKEDLFPDDVYIFTPNNEIKVLAKDATVIDFAYAVHSDVGHHCVAARVDQKMVPLRTRLHSGETVEVITKEDASPNPAWLNFVATARARSAIRSWLKRLDFHDAVEFGQRMLEKELKIHGTSLHDVMHDRASALVEEWGFEDEQQLFAEIGFGNRAPLLAARYLTESGPEFTKHNANISSTEIGAPLVLKGGEGMVVKYARCCRPIPGDLVIAGFSPGRGIVVHRRECRNIAKATAKQGDSWLEVTWSDETDGEFTCEIALEVENKSGVLASIASSIAAMDANIENISVEKLDASTTALKVIISLKNRKQLAGIMRSLRRSILVLHMYRVTG